MIEYDKTRIPHIMFFFKNSDLMKILQRQLGRFERYNLLFLSSTE